VALKKLKSAGDLSEFESEIALLQSLRHPNVLQFLGVLTSSQGEIYMVTEFVPQGSLLDFLRKQGKILVIVQLLQICKAIAAGMQYLERKMIIHRDLSCRNCLVKEEEGKFTVKLADFGLGVVMTATSLDDKTFTTKNSLIPVKWAAPEVIEKQKYSVASDVWSFGITSWEIFELGRNPYPELTNSECITEVIRGYRLPKPDACPEKMYDLMAKCWLADPTLRPTFNDIFLKVGDILSNHEPPPKRTSTYIVPIIADDPSLASFYLDFPKGDDLEIRKSSGMNKKTSDHSKTDAYYN